MIRTLDGDSNPGGFPVDSQLDSIDPGPSGFRELHIIQEDENISAGDLIEISQPWKKIGLVDGDNLTHP